MMRRQARSLLTDIFLPRRSSAIWSGLLREIKETDMAKRHPDSLLHISLDNSLIAFTSTIVRRLIKRTYQNATGRKKLELLDWIIINMQSSGISTPLRRYIRKLTRMYKFLNK
ncbi:MAG: hypothetical protein ACD_2C00155G0001 [uncultured bacterium (gcode 4)]|uniref:Uncharacterized protein n=1 Tax=uncultured bacterium (gcode 4) TaxID=1234023 RepID=K2G2U0_9BACT|nr:MAG: hypothetical protein ACD_2C00155G0001 [uncultured bacterium (gcode 4)]